MTDGAVTDDEYDDVFVTIYRLDDPAACELEGARSDLVVPCPNPATFGACFIQYDTVMGGELKVCPRHIPAAVDTLNTPAYRSEYL